MANVDGPIHTNANGSSNSNSHEPNDTHNHNHNLSNGTARSTSTNTTTSPSSSSTPTLSPSSDSSTPSTTSSITNTTNPPLHLNPSPAFTPSRTIHIITIGAGYSGMILAHKLQHSFASSSHITHKIYESRSGPGGTWLANTYPGVQCDVPSHIYAFPFAPNPEWSHFYSTGQEIREYFARTVREWGLERDVQYNARVEGAWWEEEEGRWKVRVRDLVSGTVRDEYADVLVSARGVLSEWRWPEIEGLERFEGKKVHSAAWDHGFEYEGKRIGVVGNGSSAIQILPQMAEAEGTSVMSFQRTPTWVVSRHSPAKLVGSTDTSLNPAYRDEDKERFRDAEEIKRYRKLIVGNVNRGFRMFVKGSKEQNDMKVFAARQMAEKLGNDPELCEKLIPDFEVGCRRVTPGAGYLEAFTQENVRLDVSGIARVEERGIWTNDGTFYELDVIVCATGFDVSQRPPFPVVGRNGVDLRDKWKDEPESYLSLACPDFPNYFIFTGPNATVGHGSLIYSLDWTAAYILQWLEKMLREEIASVAPKQSVVDEFIAYGDEVMKTLTWTGSCRSWYKNNRVDGRVTATWPGSAMLFWECVKQIRPEDFKIRYRSANRWRFMGSGFTAWEREEGADLAWYVEN